MEEGPTLQRRRPPVPVTEGLAITVARGPDAGKLLELGCGASAQIGAAADNDLVLSDPTVSRYHVELAPGATGVHIRDLGSLNGTFVGQVRVDRASFEGAVQIRVGDTLLFADTKRKDPAEPAPVPEIPGLVRSGAAMDAVARAVHAYRDFGGAILVAGETGTGKEVVAHALHALSSRASGPFVTVDCGALPATLAESELFGHERGSFTGADRRYAGAFERAHGGTLFLDEVGELSPQLQATLLGVLERRRLRRLGGDREITVDVRVISATNRDLRAEVNRGAFRADLYFRLAGARIRLPSLAERVEDVVPLVRHFAREISGVECPWDEVTLAALEARTWRGNVRELQAFVERALALGDPASAFEGEDAAPAGAPREIPRYRDARARAIADFERDYVADVIARTGGNASEAARVAGMDRPWLLALLRKHGLR